MSEEMFTQILSLAQQAGEGGYFLAVLYLLQPYFINTLVVGALAYIARMVIHKIPDYYDRVLTDRVASAAGVMDSRPYYNFSYIKMHRWIDAQLKEGGHGPATTSS